MIVHWMCWVSVKELVSDNVPYTLEHSSCSRLLLLRYELGKQPLLHLAYLERILSHSGSVVETTWDTLLAECGLCLVQIPIQLKRVAEMVVWSKHGALASKLLVENGLEMVV